MDEPQPFRIDVPDADSPVGLLAWNSQVMGGLDSDAILTHMSIHWLTGTAASALRSYADDAREPRPDGPTTVPLGLAQPPGGRRARLLRGGQVRSAACRAEQQVSTIRRVTT